MESFHLFHLAHVWRPHLKLTTGKGLPPTNLPVEPLIVPAPSQQTLDAAPTIKSDSGSPRQPPRIRAAAVQMIFACRRTQSFIEPEQVAELEAWSGLAVLQALSGFKIPPEVRDHSTKLSFILTKRVRLSLRICIKKPGAYGESMSNGVYE